ncbi:MAG: hypothetical protein HYU97_00975 [Deltaproteobacteria bacterium]|nr:hypothetical protein [Deltaproteobacteria bacterium]
MRSINFYLWIRLLLFVCAFVTCQSKIPAKNNQNYSGNYQSMIDGSKATLGLSKNGRDTYFFLIDSFIKLDPNSPGYSCNLTGTIRVSNGEASWVAKEKGSDIHCRLRFLFKKNHIEVMEVKPSQSFTGLTCRYYCGQAASFIGTYQKLPYY